MLVLEVGELDKDKINMTIRTRTKGLGENDIK